MGDAPELIEASLLQAYAPRDPIAEFLHGRISARQLRVMIENLPPSSPWVREHDPWTQTDYLLWHVESRLRDLVATEHTELAVLTAGLHIKGSPSPPDVKYIVPPARERAVDGSKDDVHARERAELAALVNR